MFSRKIALVILSTIIVGVISCIGFYGYIVTSDYPSPTESTGNIIRDNNVNLPQTIGDNNVNLPQLKSTIEIDKNIPINQSNENNGDDDIAGGVGIIGDGNIISNNGSISFENNKEKLTLKNKFEEQFNLERGRAIHSISDRFKINIPKPIEASIVPKIIDQEKLIEQLKIQGDPKIIQDEILYSPSGVDIKLKIDKDRFKIREVNTGIKPIISEIPELWIWEVTPLKKGNTNITLLVEIKLKNKQDDKEFVKNFTIFNEPRTVDSNLSYSISQFISNFWKELATFLFGSGTFAGFVKWYIERRDANKAKKEPEPEPEPEPTRLIDRLKRKLIRRE